MTRHTATATTNVETQLRFNLCSCIHDFIISIYFLNSDNVFQATLWWMTSYKNDRSATSHIAILLLVSFVVWSPANKGDGTSNGNNNITLWAVLQKMSKSKNVYVIVDEVGDGWRCARQAAWIDNEQHHRNTTLWWKCACVQCSIDTLHSTLPSRNNTYSGRTRAESRISLSFVREWSDGAAYSLANTPTPSDSFAWEQSRDDVDTPNIWCRHILCMQCICCREPRDVCKNQTTAWGMTRTHCFRAKQFKHVFVYMKTCWVSVNKMRSRPPDRLPACLPARHRSPSPIW